MLSDRPYLRGDYRRETTSAVTWLICAIAGAFFLQFAAVSGWGTPAAGIVRELAFSVENLAAGRVWTIFTHWLLHSTGNLFHVGLVLAGVYLLGRELLGVLGAKRFIGVFFGGVLVGSLVWGALNWQSNGILIGSTAGVYGLLAVYALIYPNREASFLLLFFFPVTFRPKQLAVALAVFDALAVGLVDILDRSLPFAYAPSAHLGGMLAGWAYYQFAHESNWQVGGRSRAAARATALETEPSDPTVGLKEPPNAPGRTREEIRAQVDRILDKINSQGLNALTPTERRILDDAKELLSRR